MGLLPIPPLKQFQIDVSSELETIEPGIKTTFGWRDLPRQSTSPNPIINWVPGASKIVPVQLISQNPRGLYDIDESFKVFIRAHDPTAPQDEAKQYATTLNVFGLFAGCFYRQAGNRAFIESFDWNTQVDPEKRLGAGIIANCRMRYNIADLSFEVGTPTLVNAEIEQTIDGNDGGTPGAVTYVVFEP